jgi:hypothetical protein
LDPKKLTKEKKRLEKKNETPKQWPRTRLSLTFKTEKKNEIKKENTDLKYNLKMKEKKKIKDEKKKRKEWPFNDTLQRF